MKREDFKKNNQIKKCLEDWQKKRQLQMQLDNLGIRANGDLCAVSGGGWNTETKEFDNYTLMPAFENNENCSYDDMEKRIKFIVYEIIE